MFESLRDAAFAEAVAELEGRFYGGEFDEALAREPGGPAEGSAPGDPDPSAAPRCLPPGHLAALPRSVMLSSLASCQPGPAVMAQLAALDARLLTGDERIDYLVAWERCEAWAAAGKQRALAAMGTPSGDPDPLDVHLELAPAPGSTADRFVRDNAVDERVVHAEVGFALRLGPSATETRLATARALAGPAPTLPGTFAALGAKHITFLHALAIREALHPLTNPPGEPVGADAPVVAQAEDRALRVATRDTI